MIIRALIVDDEPLAREGIRQFLDDEPDVEVVGECGDGASAVDLINRVRPELVFLDIQMPEMDGFAVLADLDLDPLPAVIFVTAYDEHALRAFEVHALDYLLKPVERTRFGQAVERARAMIHHASGAEVTRRIAALLRGLDQRRQVDRLPVKTAHRTYFVPVADIDWIEAAGNYARVHTGGERHIIRQTMSALERVLDAKQFARVHRSAIVNVDRIKEIQPWVKGDHVVILRDGTRLSLSRKYRRQLEERWSAPGQ
jgi:two-component system LytT family response regulator